MIEKGDYVESRNGTLCIVTNCTPSYNPILGASDGIDFQRLDCVNVKTGRGFTEWISNLKLVHKFVPFDRGDIVHLPGSSSMIKVRTTYSGSQMFSGKYTKSRFKVNKKDQRVYVNTKVTDYFYLKEEGGIMTKADVGDVLTGSSGVMYIVNEVGDNYYRLLRITDWCKSRLTHRHAVTAYNLDGYTLHLKAPKKQVTVQYVTVRHLTSGRHTTYRVDPETTGKTIKFGEIVIRKNGEAVIVSHAGIPTKVDTVRYDLDFLDVKSTISVEQSTDLIKATGL